MIDPERLSQTYSFIVLVGEDKETLAQLERVATVVERRYPIILLRVTKSPELNGSDR